MRKSHYTYLIRCVLFALLGLTACDVHEFPEAPAEERFILRLTYETDLPQWEHHFASQTGKDNGITSRSVQSRGEMRYTIRAYPAVRGKRAAEEAPKEFTFTRDVADGYDCEFTLEMAPGEYNLMVWSDLAERSDDASFYDATNFAEICLQGGHEGNNDYRDAFRGTHSLQLAGTILEQAPDTVDILMQRPLAKYEFITTDLKEFIDKETTLLMEQTKGKSVTSEQVSSRVNIDEYKVVFYYVGFMPNAYSMFTDKPVDSTTGVMFESKLNALNDKEASMGFDYVFVNGTESSVLVQIALFNKEGEQISLSNPIEVPLKRSWHTLMRGTFLMQKATGGVGIDPSFEGDFNLKI